MLENINLVVTTWDWKAQMFWDENIATIISRIEREYYKTKEVDINLTTYDLTNSSFGTADLFDFAVHYKLVENADLQYPVIVNMKWNVIDWRHRVLKAILQWDKTIKWIMILDTDITWKNGTEN